MEGSFEPSVTGNSQYIDQMLQRIRGPFEPVLPDAARCFNVCNDKICTGLPWLVMALTLILLITLNARQCFEQLIIQ